MQMALCEMKYDLCGEIGYTSRRQQTTAYHQSLHNATNVPESSSLFSQVYVNIWMILMTGEK